MSREGRLRQEQIERDLPDFLDILAVTVRAGLGYRLALGRVAEALGGPVGEEMLVALRQMSLGATRRAAFEALRDRNASEQLSSFVAAQLQAEELGVPLSEALNDIAARHAPRGPSGGAPARRARDAPRQPHHHVAYRSRDDDPHHRVDRARLWTRGKRTPFDSTRDRRADPPAPVAGWSRRAS